MLRRVLIPVGWVLLAGLPTHVSAATCQGFLSWLCANADASKEEQGQAKQQTDEATALDGPAATRFRGVINQPVQAGSGCLSRAQIHSGYPRYRVINGRRCWYASTKSQQRKQLGINPNPYDDPIWKEPEMAKAEPTSCELQALKLDAGEKRTFMKQCTQ